MQQEIAELVADGGGFALAQRMIELEHFLDQVRAQRLPGLRPVPRTALPEVAHHRAARAQALNCLAFISLAE